MKKVKLLILIQVFLLNTSLSGQEVMKSICIGEKFIIKSKILNQERKIFIALPKDYEEENTSFPVHYVLDGDITFRSYSSIVNLKSHSEEIPKAIVVGIPNIDRHFDLDPRQNGINFLNFITNELIQYIDKNYKTNKDRVLIGYSMSGNFAMHTFLSDQESFNMFLSGSPYRLDLYDRSHIANLLNNIKTKKTIYTSMGSKDRPKQIDFFRVFCDSFEKIDNSLVDFKYEIVSNRNHDSNYLLNWQDGLNYLYRDWKTDIEQ